MTSLRRAEGFDVLEAADGATGEALALREDPALILLDLMLPRRDGFSVLRNLRQDRLAVPIIILTARGEEFDRIQGFEFGADDFLIKPFSIAELLLRIQALIARSGGGAPGVPGSADRARFGETEVDFTAFTVTCAGRQSALSRRVLELLDYFLPQSVNLSGVGPFASQPANLFVEPTSTAPVLISAFDPDGWNSMRVEIRNRGPGGPYDSTGPVSPAVYSTLTLE